MRVAHFSFSAYNTLMKIKSFESMGTHFRITVWDDISEEEFEHFTSQAIVEAEDFDRTYSRFKKDSFVSEISDKTGIIEVPRQFMEMLVHYYRGYLASDKKVNPLVGNTISDLGYDAEYSLSKKDQVRSTPDLLHVVHILDSSHIELDEKVLFDFGALGKGYFVDRIRKLATRAGYKKFLIDGSGDLDYEGEGSPLSCGLEDPRDTSKVIGRMVIYKGAFAASATNRRAWREYNHYIDPHKSDSVKNIIATWVTADDCVIADYLTSALFFVSFEKLRSEGYEFEACVMNSEGKIAHTEGFNAEFY